MVKQQEGIKVAGKNQESVIILGTAGTLNVTPWDLPDYDYWACSPVLTYDVAKGRRIDLVFELHQMEYWITIRKRLIDIKKPIYMLQKTPEINNSIAYPLKYVQSMVDNPRMKKYFMSTISYMIALAIYAGYKCIELYGVHMAATQEQYSIQRNSCEAWLAYAEGKGIKIWVPDESDLFKCSYMYGYEQEKDVILKLMSWQEECQNGKNHLEKQLEEKKKQYWQQVGGLQAIQQAIHKFK